jgi:hypothetical protein
MKSTTRTSTISSKTWQSIHKTPDSDELCTIDSQRDMVLIINFMIDVAAPMGVEILTRGDLQPDRTSVVAMASSADWHWHDLELLLLYLSAAQ